MSLHGYLARPGRSAWVARDPSGSRRSRRPARAETMSMLPSGSQPVPIGMAGTAATTSRRPAASTATTSPAPMSDSQSRPSCQRGDSPIARPVVSVCIGVPFLDPGVVHLGVEAGPADFDNAARDHWLGAGPTTDANLAGHETLAHPPAASGRPRPG